MQIGGVRNGKLAEHAHLGGIKNTEQGRNYVVNLIEATVTGYVHTFLKPFLKPPWRLDQIQVRLTSDQVEG